ncbi:MAG: ferritin [Tissierellia bacterium]|jgi:ferritin|nr:ferritin [Tissierellia bacterium]MDD3227172.1 ferritin [Tissierellia bacterium]MDD3751254.1 ferritin [Tissierellia bacterium]MDD4045642.1 ferritin [Tissierellia bacterium]MDD4678280.1 ferritin [Tissierellia bacterium]
MINDKVAKLMNEQVNKELYSAYLYLDMANYYIDNGLDGFANWFKIQAQEERDHAMLFMQYMQNNQEKVTLEEIKAPDVKFDSFASPLAEALKHEQYVTASINNIYAAANEIKDFRAMQFLDWFIMEQGEEEKNSDDLITKYNLFGSDAKGLYMLNSEMGSRVYSPPSLVLD